MAIIVIDNYSWETYHHVGISPRPAYCVSTADKSPDELYVELHELCWKEYRSNSEVYYLINVHCIFKSHKIATSKKYYSQDQLGLVIYRHLLKIYENEPHFLKVVFFSPIPKEGLIFINKENAVLEHHLLLSVPFSWDKCVAAIETKNDWSVFNNASESLLSGWSINGRESIKTNGKDIIFIDDQTQEWITTYKQIIDNPKAICFFTYKKNENPYGEFSPTKIKETDFKTKAHQADLIISDFYLQENHDTSRWLSKSELGNISGYRMYRYIKNELNAGIPMVMHTSSNKVRYFQFLERSGLDDWTSKDIRLDITKTEKKYNYESVKNTIEKFTIGPNSSIYADLKEIWKKIERIKERTTSNWWYSHTLIPQSPQDGMLKLNINTKQNLIEILTDAYFALRNYLKREDLLADELQSKDVNFSASAISSNLGNIYELLGFSQTEKNYNLHLRYFFSVRNAASHFASYKYFTIEDTIIYFHYWLLALEDNEPDVKIKFKKEGQAYIEQPKRSKFRLLYIWIQFHNSRNRPISSIDKLSVRIKNRIHTLLNIIDQKELYNELFIEPETRDKVVLQWITGKSDFRIVADGKNGKLKLSNA